MATIKDVAQMAGVSIATVSKYINGGNIRPENIQPIKDAIQALDYRVNPFARSLKAKQAHSVGILLPDIAVPFFGSVVTAIDKTLRERGYHALIACYSSNHGLEREKLSFLIKNGIEGLIYFPEDLSAEEFHELTGNCPIPTVQVDRVIQGLSCDAVLVNNAETVYDATTRLIRKGHRRIGLISGPKYVFSARERQAGFLKALSNHDIPFDDALFFSENFDFATGYQGCEALLALPNRPTAVISTNYDITLGLVTAIRDHGLSIPEDMDVIGFDCVEVCSMMKPPLPVIQQPEQLIGQTAAGYLIQRLEGFSGPERITRLACNILPSAAE